VALSAQKLRREVHRFDTLLEFATFSALFAQVLLIPAPTRPI